MDTREPPARRTICIECRTIGREEASCPRGRRHHVVSLDSEDGRTALRSEVWETPWAPRASQSSPMRLVAAAVVPMTVGLAVGTVWNSAQAAAGTALALWGALAGKAALPRRQRADTITPPRGRPGHLRVLGRRDTRQRGILRGPLLTAPLTGRPCLGYSVILRATEFFGGDIMLIDAWIGQGSVTFHDGRTLHVPEGLVEIDHPAPTRITDQDAIERYLARVVPGQASPLPDGARPLFPYDVVTESIIPTDAEVEVIGRLVELPGMYRDTGRSWRMRDVPMVRVVEPPLHMPTYAEP